MLRITPDTFSFHGLCVHNSQYLFCPCPDPPAQAKVLPTPPADLAIFSMLFFALPFLFLNNDAHSAGVLPGLPAVLLQPLPGEAAADEETKRLQSGELHLVSGSRSRRDRSYVKLLLHTGTCAVGTKEKKKKKEGVSRG